ncbi:MAG: type II toxin-antitoxin system RelE/ParE family toxin [Mariprofundaceae bacterium]|nr:type II toxin-antitoxin system RelE/ParE family toxin [Mariprofundaceae bacterium]
MPLPAEQKQVTIYLDSNGDAPFSNWINDLADIKGRAKIRERIARLRLGNMGDCEPVGEGVSELRVHYGPGYRVYFGQEGQKIVVLILGGSKRTQKKDIKTAKVLWKDYKERENEK